MYSSIIHPINGERVAIQSILGKKLLMNYASQLIGGTTPTNVDIHQRVMSGGAGGPVSINLQPLKTLVNSTDPREDYYEEEHPRIIHTLHKLEELLRNASRRNIILIGDSGGHGAGFFDLLEKLIIRGYLAPTILNTLVICTEGTPTKNEFGVYIDAIAPNKIYLDKHPPPKISELTDEEYLMIRCGVANPMWSDLLIGSVRKLPHMLHIVCVGNSHITPQVEHRGVKRYSTFYKDSAVNASGGVDILPLEETIVDKAPLIRTQTIAFRFVDESIAITDNTLFQLQDSAILDW